jgi:hypothetical protein
VEADPRDPSKVRGFDVEVAEEIAKELGRRSEFVQVAFNGSPAEFRHLHEVTICGMQTAKQHGFQPAAEERRPASSSGRLRLG